MHTNEPDRYAAVVWPNFRCGNGLMNMPQISSPRSISSKVRFAEGRRRGDCGNAMEIWGGVDAEPSSTLWAWDMAEIFKGKSCLTDSSIQFSIGLIFRFHVGQLMPLDTRPLLESEEVDSCGLRAQFVTSMKFTESIFRQIIWDRHTP